MTSKTKFKIYWKDDCSLFIGRCIYGRFRKSSIDDKLMVRYLDQQLGPQYVKDENIARQILEDAAKEFISDLMDGGE